jgi:predicted Zn-dependent protease with MMP-like domain
VTRREFEEVVREALDGIPEPIRSKLQNTIFAIEDDSDDGSMLGLYEGIPFPDRSDASMSFPDRITLYQKPIERTGGTRSEIIREIQVTIAHEIGHFLGLSEEDLERMGLA